MDTKVSVLCLLLFLSRGHSNDVMERQADSEVAAMTTVVNQLTAQVNTLNTQLTAMNAELNQKNEVLNSLDNDLDHSEAVINDLTRQLNLNGKQVDHLDNVIHRTDDALDDRTTTLETPVAFTVRFLDDDVGNLTMRIHNQPVLLFDKIQYQTGGVNYNSSTGVFTAPTKGVYAFFLTVQRNDLDLDLCLQATLIRNENSYFGCQAAACPPEHTTASVTCLIHLRQGESVHVTSTNNHLILGHVHTTFSGVRISPK